MWKLSCILAQYYNHEPGTEKLMEMCACANLSSCVNKVPFAFGFIDHGPSQSSKLL